MNKPEIVARLAARLGLDKFTSEGAVDIVLVANAEGLAKAEDAGGCGLRHRQVARKGRNPRAG